MNINEFLKRPFKARTDFIDIPELCKICATPETPIAECAGRETPCAFCKVFDDGPRVGVEVRGLDGIEFAKINAAGSEDRRRVAYELLAADGAGMASAVKEYLGVGEAPPELEKEICYFEQGVIWPVFKSDEKIRFAAKLNKVWRPVFHRVVVRIYQLTGEGQAPEG